MATDKAAMRVSERNRFGAARRQDRSLVTPTLTCWILPHKAPVHQEEELMSFFFPLSQTAFQFLKSYFPKCMLVHVADTGQLMKTLRLVQNPVPWQEEASR